MRIISDHEPDEPPFKVWLVNCLDQNRVELKMRAPNGDEWGILDIGEDGITLYCVLPGHLPRTKVGELSYTKVNYG